MKNSKKGSEFIKWEIGSVPPRIDSSFSGFIIITNLYPLTEEIQWWLGKLALPFIAGKVFKYPFSLCIVFRIS